MNIYTIIIYLIATLILWIILNILEKKKEDNLLEYIIISNIYILVLSSLFKSHSNNIFLIVIFQTITNILYTTYVKERSFINNNLYNIIKYLLNIIISYMFNILFINKIESIFLSVEETKQIIWILLIGYLYINLKNNQLSKRIEKKKELFYQDNEYIVMQYAKYKNKYSSLITSKYNDINLLMYSIMIYENYHKPKLIRQIDNIKYKFFSKKGYFGIMQIESKHPLTDEESIELAIKKLEKIYTTNKKEKINIHSLIKKYYKKDNKPIEEIYQVINKFISNK